MKKSKIWMVTTVIAIIVAIVLGYNFLNQKKAYATTKENDYNMAFYQVVEYVQNVKKLRKSPKKCDFLFIFLVIYIKIRFDDMYFVDYCSEFVV